MSDREKVKALAAKMGCTIEVSKEGHSIDINIDAPLHKCFSEELHTLHTTNYIEWTKEAWTAALEDLQQATLEDCKLDCPCYDAPLEDEEELSEVKE